MYLSLGLKLNNKNSSPIKTAEFESLKDSWIIQSLPDNNYNGNNDLQLTSTALGMMASLIYFDLSSLVGKSVVKAEMSLYALNMDDNTTINAKRIITDWVENTVTWTTKPSFSSEYAGNQVLSGSGWKNFNVTNLVKDVLGGADYYGIYFYNAVLNGLWCRFSARENLYMPKLTVNYRG